jgi:G3E family GTPase
VGDRVPVTLVTGFLGSGKTTLLASLLRQPALADTAVIMNELGEVPLDHHLLRRVDERTVVLASGCVCCSLRGDLADELRDLLSRRARGVIPSFRRVVVETTGLADPAPILNTLLTEPVLRHHVEPGAVIATADAVHGLGQLDRHGESVRQAAAADRIIVTKADVAERDTLERLKERLRRLNPAAELLEVSLGDTDALALLAPGASQPRDLAPDQAGKHGDIHAFALVLEQPLDWTVFGVWLTMLLRSHGRNVLRVKGLLDVGGTGPVVLNGVQHVVHPPIHLDAWPDEDRRSWIVFIACGIEPHAVEESLAAFGALAGR